VIAMQRQREWSSSFARLALVEPRIGSPEIVGGARAPGMVALMRRFWASAAVLLSEWRRRVRSRRELTKLSDLELWDLAVSRDARDVEVRKPFWCA
jgi:uncharacterized protein YjiS (DUF1127 family)